MAWIALGEFAVPASDDETVERALTAARGAGGYVATGGAGIDRDDPVEWRWKGAVWTSEDALAWRRVADQPFDGALFSVTAALGGIVAVGPVAVCLLHCDTALAGALGSAAWYTADRRHWQRSSSGLEDAVVLSVAGNEEIVVAAGFVGLPGDVTGGTRADAPSSSTAGALWTSTDARTWTPATGVPETVSIDNVAESNGAFVAIARRDGTGYPVLLRSDDGISWTEVGALPGQVVLTSSPLGFLVAGGSAAPYFRLRSVDGRDWEPVPAAAAADDVQISDLAWIEDRYLALGSARRGEDRPAVGLVSADGETWSEVGLPPGLSNDVTSQDIASIGDRAMVFSHVVGVGYEVWLVATERP